MNLMTRANQTRHQLPADRPRRTSRKHPHHQPLDRGIIHTPYDKTAAPEVTPPGTPAPQAATRPHPPAPGQGAHKPAAAEQPLDRRRPGGAQATAEKQDGHRLPAELRSVRDFARKEWPPLGSPADVGRRETALQAPRHDD